MDIEKPPVVDPNNRLFYAGIEPPSRFGRDLGAPDQ